VRTGRPRLGRGVDPRRDESPRQCRDGVPQTRAAPRRGYHLAALAEEKPDNGTRWELLEECRLDPERPPTSSYERKSDQRVSSTDPDAALMRPRGARACLGYHDHCVVDGGKARIILHALVTPADIMENQPMLDQLRRVIFRWRVKPTRIIADTTYATIDNIRAL
jgi:hypothetical protein